MYHTWIAMQFTSVSKVQGTRGWQTLVTCHLQLFFWLSTQPFNTTEKQVDQVQVVEFLSEHPKVELRFHNPMPERNYHSWRKLDLFLACWKNRWTTLNSVWSYCRTIQESPPFSWIWWFNLFQYKSRFESIQSSKNGQNWSIPMFLKSFFCILKSRVPFKGRRVTP